jgi:hypothetical protein
VLVWLLTYVDDCHGGGWWLFVSDAVSLLRALLACLRRGLDWDGMRLRRGLSGDLVDVEALVLMIGEGRNAHRRVTVII